MQRQAPRARSPGARRPAASPAHPMTERRQHEPRQEAIPGRRRALPGAVAARQRAVRLAHAAGPHHRAVSARRLVGHHRPHPGAPAERRPEPDRGGREQARGQRQSRRWAGSAGRAGGAYGAAVRRRRAGDQPVRLHQAVLRSLQGPARGGHAGLFAARARGASGRARADGARAGRAVEEAAPQLRGDGHRQRAAPGRGGRAAEPRARNGSTCPTRAVRRR